MLSCIAVEPVKRSSAPYNVRTFRVVVALTSAKPQGHRPAKTSRIELRATEDDRSSFLLTRGRLAAQPVLADRDVLPELLAACR